MQYIPIVSCETRLDHMLFFWHFSLQAQWCKFGPLNTHSELKVHLQTGSEEYCNANYRSSILKMTDQRCTLEFKIARILKSP